MQALQLSNAYDPTPDMAAPALPAAVDHWRQWQTLEANLATLLLEPYRCPTFITDIATCAATLLSLTARDPDVAIFHMVHATPEKMNRYGVMHAMHTGMLLALIGLRKDWGDARNISAIKAGLTMNISITALQVELAQQAGPLTPEQKVAIDAHPLGSWKMLHDLGVTDEEWLIAVAQHHERPDGKGYPQGLTEIHPLADAIRTCDVFGAKMSPRAGRARMPTPRAAAEIFRQRSAGYFGATIIRELGLYPPGCLVELCTGEQALVIQRHRDPHTPDVVVLSDTQGHALAHPYRCTTTRTGGHLIIGAAPDQSWSERISPEDILSLK